jgi:hypothetical protein
MKAIRNLENSHIFLWLIKDTCWVMEYRIPGMVMIIPTVTMAVYLTWLLRKDLKELLHNLAVCCWICANSVWMIGEFYLNDTARPFAAVLFLAGLGFIIYYYISFFIKNKVRTK